LHIQALLFSWQEADTWPAAMGKPDVCCNNRKP